MSETSVSALHTLINEIAPEFFKISIKSKRRKAHKQKALYNAGILGRASKIGSKLYACIPSRYRRRSHYQQLTAWAMQLLRDEWDEAEILEVLVPPKDRLQTCHPLEVRKSAAGVILHPNKQSYFIASLYKRFQEPVGETLPLITRVCDPGLIRYI
jgi:hypothetical protein